MTDFDFNDDLTASAGIRAAASIINGGEKALTACVKCNGSGMTRWGRCFRCEGKGRITVRSAAASKARVTAAANVAQWKADNAALIGRLEAIRDWNTFAQSLLSDIDTYGKLLDWKVEKAVKMLATIDAKRAEKRAERDTGKAEVDVSAIERLFATASSNGLKRPVFRAEGIEISLASASGRNPGAIYVKAGGEYQGKVQGGRFHPVRECLPTTGTRLLEVAADPLGQATLYGKQTGSCSCCGRELTDPVSVEAGIGPICAGKWGL